ncbi:hypothetical protein [Asanoa iriomotensis]|uniref:Uncharacterized protein n=1 Tax=Asanoa iriomotensis TaxID=234613 RepID=A0ABQ4CF52_9ACTN|nr:hypothetical protein [Asanoa iriomotensis]GIF61395.1 hypothetical protein Air01nite_74900 [Asanoa iriomotensis]
MADPHVTLEPDPRDPVQRKLQGPLEEQLTSALQAATDRVRASYRGEPFDVVCRRLLEETRAGLHQEIAAGFEPDLNELARVAVAIIRGQA